MASRIINRTFVAPLLALVFLAAAAAGWYAVQATGSTPARTAAFATALTETDADIKIYKTPTCGCCSAWVEHLANNGFTVDAVNVDQEQLNSIKQQAGVTRELASCHTAFIDGYVVEGHVPAQDIRRLVDEKPSIRGLSVPGMPVGSPGMEMGDRYDPFDVVGFDQQGSTSVFSSYNQ
ncbi:MAG: DUF411 domain-containing protein [Aquisalimonadaceae bacterium]